MNDMNDVNDIDKIVAEALGVIRERSYAKRHPELGKMFRCSGCGRRHRGEACDIRYVLKNPGIGKSNFKGRRLVPRGQARKNEV